MQMEAGQQFARCCCGWASMADSWGGERQGRLLSWHRGIRGMGMRYTLKDTEVQEETSSSYLSETFLA